jgi:hypothetical protein
MDTQTVTTLMDAKTERKMRTRVSRKLQALPIYHDGLPIQQIDEILDSCGFSATESAIYCGREGSATHQVGRNTFLAMTWYKMESGRYEIVAYVS